MPVQDLGPGAIAVASDACTRGVTHAGYTTQDRTCVTHALQAQGQRS